MKRIIFYVSIIFLNFLFQNCSNESSNPTITSKNKIELGDNLFKTGWVYSQIKDWPLEHKVYSCGSEADLSTYKYSMDFNNFHFSFNFSLDQDNAYSVTKYEFRTYVNNSFMKKTKWSVWPGDHVSGWSNWENFNYNGTDMSYRFYKDVYTFDNCYWYFTNNRIRKVQVRCIDYVSPNSPSNFNVTPTVHPSTNVNPKLTWSQTSDGDVTHVEIWRRNNVPSTSYSKIATISKSNTSYTDYSCNWNLPMGRTYWYKIRFKDATHNLYSSFTNEKSSSSL